MSAFGGGASPTLARRRRGVGEGGEDVSDGINHEEFGADFENTGQEEGGEDGWCHRERVGHWNKLSFGRGRGGDRRLPR